VSGPDRVNYSYGMKVSLGNYESADFHMSLSSDVRDSETPEQALERVKEFVENESEKKFDELREIANARKA
jgi:hypothetical protein